MRWKPWEGFQTFPRRYAAGLAGRLPTRVWKPWEGSPFKVIDTATRRLRRGGSCQLGLLPVVRYGRFNSQSAQGDDVGVRLQHRRHATYAYDGSSPSQPPATPAPAGHLGSSEALSRESQVLYLGPGLEKSSSGDVGTGNTGRN